MKKVFLTTLLVMCIANVAFAGQWIQNGDAWLYQEDDESFVTNQQKKIDGNYYYFDENGCLLTGYQAIEKDFYIFNSDGTPKTEPIVYDGVTYNVTSRGKIRNINAAIFEKLKDNEFITSTGELAGDLAYAKKLVDTYPISKKALRIIMESKGITIDKIDYVVANTNINWINQATKCATKFLEYRDYDKETLYAILLLEGFTAEEANSGANISLKEKNDSTNSENEINQDVAKYIEEMKALSALIS